MKSLRSIVVGTSCLIALLAADAATAQTPSPTIPVEKLNPYVECINDLSGRAYQAR